MIQRRYALPAITLIGLVTSLAHAQSYKVDPDHSTTVFRIHHFNAGYVWGLITQPAGSVMFDPNDPTKLVFHVKVSLDKIDTGNKQRDDDLKGQDWFNAKQFPEMTFDSTSVKKDGDNRYAVTGDLTIHGVKKTITTSVDMTGQAKGMRGEDRRGFETTFTVNRNDYDIKAMPGGVGDDVRIIVALEGVAE